MKILHTVFGFMLGSAFTTLLINARVIGGQVTDLTDPAQRAIYNLHDHLLPYAIFFIGATLICGTILLVMTILKPTKKSELLSAILVCLCLLGLLLKLLY